MNVKLLEKPDGYTSRYYKFTVGKTYKVRGTYGSCYLILDDAGDTAYVACSRFEIQE
jgi:hypothetical protein